MSARVVVARGAVLLARRDDLPLGTRWDLPRGGEASALAGERRDEGGLEVVHAELEAVSEPLAWHELDALVARWSRAEIALSADAAAVVRRLRGQSPLRLAAREGATSIEIAPSIRMIAVRTPTLPPAQHTNLFVIGSRDAVLIEPATADDAELDRVAEWVGALEAEGVRLTAIAPTHHHGDHVAGARPLRRALDAPLIAHSETAARTPRIAFDQHLGDGARVELEGPEPVHLRAVLTPGHAPGHLCFHDERSGALIAGDMVAGVGTILVEPGDGDMALYLESLRRLASLDARVLVPAHGGVMRPPGMVLERYVEHRLARERRVLDALLEQRGPARAVELLPLAYADAPRAAWGLAALSTEAHLIKLERDGAVQRTAAGWVAA